MPWGNADFSPGCVTSQSFGCANVIPFAMMEPRNFAPVFGAVNCPFANTAPHKPQPEPFIATEPWVRMPRQSPACTFGNVSPGYVSVSMKF